MSETKLHRVIFTCGGTAGHVNPAIALAQLMQRENPKTEVLFVGAERGLEKDLVPKAGYPFRTVHISSFHRSFRPKEIRHNLVSVGNLMRAPHEARAILRDFRPDVVVGTGGYASFPVVNEAARRKIPTAVHESNAVPGLTTKALARVVDRVMVGFEESRSHYDDPSKVVVTGTPVRGDFFKYTRQEAREKLGLADERPLLLSYWGSLGAEVMNQKMVDFIAKECYEGAPIRHIHGAGRDFPWMREELLRRGLKLGDNGVEVREYIYDMPLVMAAADVVLCRAGASTISEITAIAKPSVLVPSPNVTANHQEKNARVLADQGAAILLREQDCGEHTLYDTVELLMQERDRRDAMVRALNAMAVPNAGEKIYQTLREIMRDKA